jgi:hypothetical protein
MLARARVCTTFQTGTNPTGTFLGVMDGDLSLDSGGKDTSAVRGTVDITVNGTRFWPTYSTSLLAPYGNEIFLERGIQYSDASVEYVKLGYFRIQAPEQSGLSDSPIRLTCVDRMQAIIDGKLISPRQFLPGATFASVVSNLITEIYPAATINYDDASASAVLARSLIVDSDRFAALDDVIRSLGKIWYWDGAGVLQIKTPPSPATAPVYEVTRGAYGVLVAFARSLSRENTYNAVVASGEGADSSAPIRAVAIDNNPLSPTYFFGRFGQVPTFFTSPLITTNAQAQASAQSLLNKQLGLPYTINFGTIVNPALEPYDVVRVHYSANESPQTHVLDTVTIPLRENAAVNSKTREQHIVLAAPLP